MNHKIVKCVWLDAETLTNHSLKNALTKQPFFVETFGKLVFQDKMWTIIQTHHDSECDDSDNNDYMKIPTPLVKEMIDLTGTNRKIKIKR
jgi:hypothetical protein